MNVCLHCARPRIYRRRLCCGCYFRQDIRALYPRQENARRGPGAENRIPTELPEPTRAQPGSPEKVKILEERAGKGLVLWSPHDYQGDQE